MTHLRAVPTPSTLEARCLDCGAGLADGADHRCPACQEAWEDGAPLWRAWALERGRSDHQGGAKAPRWAAAGRGAVAS